MKSAILILTVLAALGVPCSLAAQKQDPGIGSATLNIRSPLILSATMGFVFGLDAAPEIRIASGIGQQGPGEQPVPQAYDVPLIYAAGAKTEIMQSLRLGVSAEYFRAKMAQTRLQAFPLMATLDYVPVESQFSTYVGVGAGVAFSNFEWAEQNFSQSKTIPAFRALLGVELDFDKHGRAPLLGSFIVEARYTHIPFSIDYLGKNYAAGGSGISFAAGISLQFERW